MERISDLKQSVNELCELITISHEILPEDSVSNAGSQHESRVTNVSKRSRASSRASAASAVSSISASRAKATAKLAMLEARATSLRKRRALQEEQFRLQQVAEELDLETDIVRQKGLCDNCLTRGHRARNCPKEGFCKVQDCKTKHTTFLHENTINKNSLSKEKSYNGKALHSQAQRESKEENSKEEEAETKAVIGYVKSTEGSTETVQLSACQSCQ